MTADQRLKQLEAMWDINEEDGFNRESFLNRAIPMYHDVILESPKITGAFNPKDWGGAVNSLMKVSNSSEQVAMFLNNLYLRYRRADKAIVYILKGFNAFYQRIDVANRLLFKSLRDGEKNLANKMFNMLRTASVPSTSWKHMVTLLLDKEYSSAIIEVKVFLKKWFEDDSNSKDPFFIAATTDSFLIGIISDWGIESKELYTLTKNIGFAPEAVRKIFLRK